MTFLRIDLKALTVPGDNRAFYKSGVRACCGRVPG